MKKRNPTGVIFLILLVSGLISLFLAFLQPSEAASAVWMGFSRQRILLIGAHFLLFLIVMLTCWVVLIKGSGSRAVQKLERFIQRSENYQVIRNILFGVALFLTFAFFYVTVFIPQALSPVTGWLTFIGWMIYGAFTRSVKAPEIDRNAPRESVKLSWKSLTKRQKQIALVLLAIGVIYFCGFIPVNLKGAETPHDFLVYGGDEYVMYPVVLKMLSHQENLRFVFYRFFNYGDYIYGFPFYGLSALLLLPSKLIFQANFADQTQLNLLILRQLVSVLPAILSAFIFTYLATRFKNWWMSIGMFLVMLSLPGMVYYNTRFWHPDSLNLLFIALTFLTLDRDEFRFGRNYFLAAIWCGLSVATRLFGLFFFLAIAGLLAAAILKKVITLKTAIVKGGLFILLMAGTILVSSPYLFNPGEYASLQRLAEKKQVDLSQGYAEADPEGVYRTGFSAWWPHMTKWYGNGVTLGFLAVSIILGVFRGQRKNSQWVLLAWLIVTGGYLIFFVKVKSFQYMLPFLIPPYIAAWNLSGIIYNQTEPGKLSITTGVKIAAYTGTAVLFVVQLVQNIQWIVGHGVFA